MAYGDTVLESEVKLLDGSTSTDNLGLGCKTYFLSDTKLIHVYIHRSANYTYTMYYKIGTLSGNTISWSSAKTIFYDANVYNMALNVVCPISSSRFVISYQRWTSTTSTAYTYKMVVVNLDANDDPTVGIYPETIYVATADIKKIAENRIALVYERYITNYSKGYTFVYDIDSSNNISQVYTEQYKNYNASYVDYPFISVTGENKFVITFRSDSGSTNYVYYYNGSSGTFNRSYTNNTFTPTYCKRLGPDKTLIFNTTTYKIVDTSSGSPSLSAAGTMPTLSTIQKVEDLMDGFIGYQHRTTTPYTYDLRVLYLDEDDVLHNTINTNLFNYTLLHPATGSIACNSTGTGVVSTGYVYDSYYQVFNVEGESQSADFTYSATGSTTISSDTSYKPSTLRSISGSVSISSNTVYSQVTAGVFSYSATGSINLSSASSYEPSISRSTSGSINISSNSSYIEVNNYSWSFTGSINLSSASSYEPSISRSINGSVSILNNTSYIEYNDYSYSSLCSISISNNTSYKYSILILKSISGFINISNNTSYIEVNSYSWSATGSINLSSASSYEPSISRSTSGSINISSNSSYIEVNNYSYSVSGFINISSNTSYIEVNNYSWSANGSITISSNTSYDKVSSYSYSFTGSISISNNTSYLVYTRNYIKSVNGSVSLNGYFEVLTSKHYLDGVFYGGLQTFSNTDTTKSIKLVSVSATNYLYALSNNGQLVIGYGPVGSYYSLGTVDYCTNVSIDKLDSTHFIVSWNSIGSSDDSGVVVVTLSGNSILFGTPVTFSLGVTDSTFVKAINTTKFIVRFNGYFYIGDVSGSTITIGSQYSSAYSSSILFSVPFSSYPIYLAYISNGDIIYRGIGISSRTLSWGNTSTIDLNTADRGLSVSAIDSTHVLTSYVDGYQQGQCVIGTIAAGGYFTHSEEYEFSSDISQLPSNANYPYQIMIDTSKFLLAYQENTTNKTGKIRAGYIDNGTITFNDIYTFDEPVSNIYLTKLDTDKFALAYADTSNYYHRSGYLDDFIISDISAYSANGTIEITTSSITRLNFTYSATGSTTISSSTSYEPSISRSVTGNINISSNTSYSEVNKYSYSTLGSVSIISNISTNISILKSISGSVNLSSTFRYEPSISRSINGLIEILSDTSYNRVSGYSWSASGSISISSNTSYIEVNNYSYSLTGSVVISNNTVYSEVNNYSWSASGSVSISSNTVYEPSISRSISGSVSISSNTVYEPSISRSVTGNINISSDTDYFNSTNLAEGRIIISSNTEYSFTYDYSYSTIGSINISSNTSYSKTNNYSYLASGSISLTSDYNLVINIDINAWSSFTLNSNTLYNIESKHFITDGFGNIDINIDSTIDGSNWTWSYSSTGNINITSNTEYHQYQWVAVGNISISSNIIYSFMPDNKETFRVKSYLTKQIRSESLLNNKVILESYIYRNIRKQSNL